MKSFNMNKILTILSVIFLLLNSQSVMADDGVILRGCRMSKVATHQVEARARGLLNRSAEDDNPYIGSRRQLVVLASFSDRPFQTEEQTTLETWNKLFNQKNLSDSLYVGSVHDYFYDQSYGKFNLHFDLQYVEVGLSSRYASTNSDDENSQFLVQDIVDSLARRSVDWSLYDWNEDGEIEQLLIVYAGKGMNEGVANSIWPHQMWMTYHINPETYKECEKEVVSSGDRDYTIDCYCAVQELGVRSNPFGTICHEYSHCFGFPDFYVGSLQTVGRWDLMDYGNYNGNGCCPCGFSAHERMLMGWLTPEELTAKTTVSAMPALSDEGQAYLIRSNLWSDEYYILENRQQKGWDAQLPGSGLLIFHVDYDHSSWYDMTKSPNSFEFKRYDLFHANNNSFSQSGWAYPYGNNNSLTDTSMPVATLLEPQSEKGTKLMSKPVTAITVSDGLVSFQFMSDTETAVNEVNIVQEPKVLFELGAISIVRDTEGTIKKIIRKNR